MPITSRSFRNFPRTGLRGRCRRVQFVASASLRRPTLGPRSSARTFDVIVVDQRIKSTFFEERDGIGETRASWMLG